MQARKEEFTIEEARAVAAKIGVDWATVDFKLEDLVEGMEVELEHGTINPLTNCTNDDPVMTAKIALAHLYEGGDYYERLEKMEQEMEQNAEMKDLKEDAGEIGLKIKAAEKLRNKLFDGGSY